MSQPTNHWKLGLFVLAGLGLALAAAVYLGTASWREEKIRYVTYFDESVQGLDVGAPVKFRGVAVGSVGDIAVAADRRHVAVSMDLGVDALGERGLGDRRLPVVAELRAQLVAQGVTGLKYLELDFFDLSQFPPPELPFATPPHYVPAAVSTIKNIEDAVIGVSDRMPELIDRATKLVERLEQQKLPEQLARTLDHLDQLIVNLNGAVQGLDTHELSASLRAVATRADRVLARLDGDKGLLASAQRATDAMGDFAALSPEIGSELIDTLRDVRAASSALERFAEALEQEPDMLIKGRRVSR